MASTGTHPAGSAPASGLAPLDVAGRVELSLEHRPLQDHAPLRLPARQVDGRVEQRLVRDDPARLDPAGAGDDHLGPGVVDPARELVRGEAAEDDRVDGAEPRAREHRDHRLGNHRHVDDHPVAALDAQRREATGEARDRVSELAVRERRDGVRDRRVVDQRRLVGAAAVDVAVERVVAGVEAAAREPAVERRAGVVQDALPGLVPVDGGGRVGPEGLRLRERARVDLVEPAHVAQSSPRAPRGPPRSRERAARRARPPGASGRAALPGRRER